MKIVVIDGRCNLPSSHLASAVDVLRGISILVLPGCHCTDIVSMVVAESIFPLLILEECLGRRFDYQWRVGNETLAASQ